VVVEENDYRTSHIYIIVFIMATVFSVRYALRAKERRCASSNSVFSVRYGLKPKKH